MEISPFITLGLLAGLIIYTISLCTNLVSVKHNVSKAWSNIRKVDIFPTTSISGNKNGNRNNILINVLIRWLTAVSNAINGGASVMPKMTG